MASESHWSIYLIRCGDNSLYCGISNDVSRRLTEHQSQGPKCAKYLRGRTPLNLVYQRVIGTRAEASSEEYRIKNLSRRAKDLLISPKKKISMIKTRLRNIMLIQSANIRMYGILKAV